MVRVNTGESLGGKDAPPPYTEQDASNNGPPAGMAQADYDGHQPDATQHEPKKIPTIVRYFGAMDLRQNAGGHKKCCCCSQRVCITITIVFIIAIALSAGLGFGLRHRDSSSHNTNSLYGSPGITDGAGLAAAALPNGDRYVFYIDYKGNLQYAMYSADSDLWNGDLKQIPKLDVETSFSSQLSAATISQPNGDETELVVYYKDISQSLMAVSTTLSNSSANPSWSDYTTESGLKQIPEPKGFTDPSAPYISLSYFTITPFPTPDSRDLLLLAHYSDNSISAAKGTFNPANRESSFGSRWQWDNVTSNITDALPKDFKRFGDSYVSGYTRNTSGLQGDNQVAMLTAFLDETKSDVSDAVSWVLMGANETVPFNATGAVPGLTDASGSTDSGFNASLAWGLYQHWFAVHAGDATTAANATGFASLFTFVNEDRYPDSSLSVLRAEGAPRAPAELLPRLYTDQVAPAVASTSRGDTVWIYYQVDNSSISENEFKLDAATGELALQGNRTIVVVL